MDASFHFSPRPNRAADIPWQEWDADAFARAQELDRPVLLAISGSWCHWCHVMDETTYSDDRVIKMLSTRFVCIRVDTDERPDVNARYNAGGWPTTAFLTPEGDVITATTYLDPAAMLDAISTVLEAWYVNREGVTQQVEATRAMRAAERAAALAQRVPGALSPSILDIALDVVEARYNEIAPGLVEDGAAPGSERAQLRFPHPDVIRLWRYAHLRRNNTDAGDHALALARAIADGGLYDATDGGFFRYSTRPDWSAPHVEKLARDQGALLLAFAELALGDEGARDALRPAVEGTATYLVEMLADTSGGIGGSQDADEAYRAATVEERESLEAPAIDHRVFTAAAAVAARGLVAAGVAYDRPDWRTAGERAVDFLLNHLRGGNAGMYHAYDGDARLFGVLDDQVQTLLALLETYEVSGQPHYFEQARTLARIVERDWFDRGLGFRDLADEHEDTALLAEPSHPLAVNVAAAEAFLWLGRLTHDERHLELAQDTLGAFAHGLEGRGLAVADYARVVDRLLSAEPEFKIVAEWPAGEPDRVADPLHAKALRLPLAGRTVQRLNPIQDIDLMQQLGLPDVSKVAYVCAGSTCSAPLTDPDSLEAAVEDILAAPSW